MVFSTEKKRPLTGLWLALVCGLQIAVTSRAFAPQLPSARSSGLVSATALEMAKKKRRRRKDDTAKSNPKSATPAPSSEGLPDFDVGDDGADGNELPDFDLVEEAEKPKKVTKADLSNPDVVTDAMRGSTDAPVRSISELISDRKLEQTFVFDKDEEDSAIPDFTQLAAESTTTPAGVGDDGAPMGKKKARQAARRAAAIEAKESEEDSLKEVLSNVPFVTDDKGEVNAIKVCCAMLLLYRPLSYLTPSFLTQHLLFICC